MPNRLDMSTGIFSETIIANGVLPPISMAPFPSMETLQPEWFSDQPDIARSQIEILVTNDTDEFVTIPGISVGNHDWLLDHRSRSDIHRLRSDIHRTGCNIHHWPEHYPSIWLNDTA